METKKKNIFEPIRKDLPSRTRDRRKMNVRKMGWGDWIFWKNNIKDWRKTGLVIYSTRFQRASDNYLVYDTKNSNTRRKSMLYKCA